MFVEFVDGTVAAIKAKLDKAIFDPLHGDAISLKHKRSSCLKQMPEQSSSAGVDNSLGWPPAVRHRRKRRFTDLVQCFPRLSEGMDEIPARRHRLVPGRVHVRWRRAGRRCRTR